MKTVWFLTILSVCLSVKCAIGRITPNYFLNITKINKSYAEVNKECPDHTHQCFGNQPCCKTPKGIYTCCPFLEGTCCADGRHCCPYGMICLTNTTCQAKYLYTISNLETLSARKLNDIVCKDGHKCFDDMTCCPMRGGEWGCCPMPKATCCSDKIHCCPHGTTCDAKTQRCHPNISPMS